jgi:benzoyl-CoA reductase subunit C
MAPTVTEIIDRAEALYHDLDLATVCAWRERHGGAKAVGYLPIYVPRELIDAAGMLPVGLMGGRGQIEIIRGDAWFQSYICQIPRSTIELALTGRLDLLDGFLFPSICDVIRNLSGVWKVQFPDKYVRYLDVPQNYDAAVGGRFYRQELSSLYRELRTLAGGAVAARSDEGAEAALRASIARYNENRRAIGELSALRAAEPWRAPRGRATSSSTPATSCPSTSTPRSCEATSPPRAPPTGRARTTRASCSPAPSASSRRSS